MAGRSILYLGDSDFAAGFCNKLEAYACCGDMARSSELTLPSELPGRIDLIMFEPPAKSADPDASLPELIQSLDKDMSALTMQATSKSRQSSITRSSGIDCWRDCPKQTAPFYQF
jgi:hypothetical protein